jgi:hypothetical protein
MTAYLLKLYVYLQSVVITCKNQLTVFFCVTNLKIGFKCVTSVRFFAASSVTSNKIPVMLENGNAYKITKSLATLSFDALFCIKF